jgi:phage gp29-like protein
MKKPTIKSKLNELDSARTIYNTLRGLTIQRAVSMLDEAECGVYTRLAWTCRKIEKRWSVMKGLKANREGALLEMDWNIRTVSEKQLPPGMTKQAAEKQAVALRSAYEQIENIREAIRFLHLASFRGFSHLEKINAQGMAVAGHEGIVRLEPIWQWHMIRDGMNGPWRFDERLAGSYAAGQDFDPATMLMREVEDPICEIALIAYIYEMLGRKDWAGFIEVFGIPDVFFVLPPGVNEKDMDAWQAMVNQAVGDGKGLLPPGSDIKTAGGDVRGTSPFSEFVRFQREDVVLAGTGGKLTMLAESGAGTLAGNAQAEVFQRIAKSEAMAISEVFQQAIDVPLLREKFPNQPIVAWFEIASEEKEDTTAFVDNVSKLAASGYYIDAGQISERTGLLVEYKGPALAVQPISNRGVSRPWYKRIFNRRGEEVVEDLDPATDKLLAEARSLFAQAVAADLAPVAERLQQILDETSDEDLQAALIRFRDEELPALAVEALGSGHTEKVLESSMGGAVVNAWLAAALRRAE